MLLIGIIALFVLYNCGGDGGGNDSNITESTGTISGIVSGTSILVLNDDGLIVADDNTIRKSPDLDLDGDSIDESYTFTVIDVPVDENVRIYLVEGEGVFPMYFDDNGTSVNIFSLSSAAEIDLGLVDSIEGKAIPEYNPSYAPNVNPEGADDVLPTISQAVANNYVGIWDGNVHYELDNGEEGDAYVEIDLSAKGNSLDGTFYFKEDNGERVEEWTVNISSTKVGEAYSFDMPKPPQQPWHHDDDYCNDWDVKFTAYLFGPNLIYMNIQFDGTFCGGTEGHFHDEISK